MHSRTRWMLLGAFGLALVVYLVGVAHDLPYVVQRDEYEIYAGNAAQIASSHDLRPLRLNHPASTIFYPLALCYKLWHVIARHGMLWHADPGLFAAYQTEPGPFLLIGRLLSAAYAIFALPVIYLLGKRALGAVAGMIGVWFLALTPILITLTQVIRDDSACVFFVALALWRIVIVLREPSVRNQALAGAAIGLAISTKYYLGLLGGVLAVVDLLVLWRQRTAGKQAFWSVVGAAVLAGVVALGVFAITTPFFFIDFESASANLGSELRATHLGADGLSPLGNLAFYLGQAFPQELSLPRALAIAVGAVLVILRVRRAEPWLLLGFGVAHVLAISVISPLHWARWIIPALPALFLVAGYAIESMTRWLKGRSRTALLVAVTLALSILPMRAVVKLALMQTRPTTMVLARDWVVEHLPEGAAIAKERYAAPLEGTSFRVVDITAAADTGVENIRATGSEYLLTSSGLNGRFYLEPERYAKQIAFYEEVLPRQAELLMTIAPNGPTGGPVIKIYRLPAP